MNADSESSDVLLDNPGSGPVATDPSAILSMAESEYMNPTQLAFFRSRLLGMRRDILEHADETRMHLRENEPLADPNDRATAEEENLLEQRVRDRERKHLHKIEAAITRIDHGTYGYCVESGEPIGLKRLLARPTAEYCIEVQERHERRERVFEL